MLSEPELKHYLQWKKGLLPDEIEHALAVRNFARKQLGLEMHPGQVAFAGVVVARRREHVARFLTLLLTSGNRAGKTTLLAILIIYSCLGKLGQERPDEKDPKSVVRWGRKEYHWYHFGIRQEVAELVFNDIVRIFSGTHEGQRGRGCPITKSGGDYPEGSETPIADTDDKEYSEYRWIKFRPEVGGAQVHFRTTGAKALGQLGRDMHGITFDEAGIEPLLNFLVKEVFGFRRLGTGGQLIMVSTPSEELGYQFADNWKQGDPENPKRLPSWYSQRMSTRDNIGYGLTQEMFDILTADMDERTILQNVEGIFLQAKAAYFNGLNVEACFIDGLPVQAPARKGLTYLQGVDPAKTQDSAWSIVLAIVMPPAHKAHVTALQRGIMEYCACKPYLVGVKATVLKGQKSTPQLVNMTADGHNSYDVSRLGSTCYTAIDATGFGGKMFREAVEQEVPNLHNVEFGGTVQKKRKLLGNLRTVIDEGRLLLPSDGVWSQVRQQLLNYKLDDGKIEQDAVMALVCAVFLLDRTPVDGQGSVPFDTRSGYDG
jgi:hypothetical protein